MGVEIVEGLETKMVSRFSRILERIGTFTREAREDVGEKGRKGEEEKDEEGSRRRRRKGGIEHSTTCGSFHYLGVVLARNF